MDTKLFFIQIADTVFRRKHKDIEHRKFIRLRDYVPLGLRLIESATGRVCSKRVEGRTLNISKQGLCVETSTVTVNGVDIFNDAMSEERLLEIEIFDPGNGEKIRALGKVIWFDITSKEKTFLFKAGVYLTIDDESSRVRWHSLVESAKKYQKKSLFVKGMKRIFMRAG